MQKKEQQQQGQSLKLISRLVKSLNKVKVLPYIVIAGLIASIAYRGCSSKVVEKIKYVEVPGEKVEIIKDTTIFKEIVKDRIVFRESTPETIIEYRDVFIPGKDSIVLRIEEVEVGVPYSDTVVLRNRIEKFEDNRIKAEVDILIDGYLAAPIDFKYKLKETKQFDFRVYGSAGYSPINRDLYLGSQIEIGNLMFGVNKSVTSKDYTVSLGYKVKF